MSTVGEDQSAPDHGIEHGFQAPRRRQKVLFSVTVVVFAMVGFLVYLMAKGPDADMVAQRLIDAVQTALPEGDLSAQELQDAVTKIQQALETSPGNDYVLDALASLQQRVADQVSADIKKGMLDHAESILATAAEYWSERDMFSETGELRSALDNALLEQEMREEVARLIAAAQEALEGGSTIDELNNNQRIDAIRAALQQLQQALDLDPENDRAQSIRDTVRQDIVEETRRELDIGNPDRAQQLLDVAQNEWSGDSDIAALRGELELLIEEMETAMELQRLLGLGEQRLASDNLTTPAENSAVHYFRKALALDSGNVRATAGLERVAERFALLIGQAIDSGDNTLARNLLSKLIEVEPEHPDIGPLQARIEAEEESRQVEQEQEQQTALLAETQEEPLASTAQDPVIPDDDEGRLWSEVMDLCDETQLRRYIDAYPAGRYIEEAWRRRSACLEAD